MNFLAKQTTWTNLELWLFKACIFSGGISAGLYFYRDLKEAFVFLVPFFVVTGVWSAYLWMKKMNQPNNNINQ